MIFGPRGFGAFVLLSIFLKNIKYLIKTAKDLLGHEVSGPFLFPPFLLPLRQHFTPV